MVGDGGCVHEGQLSEVDELGRQFMLVGLIASKLFFELLFLTEGAGALDRNRTCI